jgi:chromosome segregation ATPase
MSNENGISGWILAGISTLIASLTTALSYLYKSRIEAYEKAEIKLDTRVELLETKLDKCETEHTNAKVELAEIKTRLNLLEKPILDRLQAIEVREVKP